MIRKCSFFLKVVLFSSVFVTQTCGSAVRSRNLATRLIPPPSFKTHLKREARPKNQPPAKLSTGVVTHLVLHPQKNNEMIAHVYMANKKDASKNQNVNLYKYSGSSIGKNAKNNRVNALKNTQRKRSPDSSKKESVTTLFLQNENSLKNNVTIPASQQLLTKVQGNELVPTFNLQIKNNDTFWVPGWQDLAKTPTIPEIEIQTPVRDTVIPVFRTLPNSKTLANEDQYVIENFNSKRKKRLFAPKLRTSNADSWTPIFKGRVLPGIGNSDSKTRPNSVRSSYGDTLSSNLNAQTKLPSRVNYPRKLWNTDLYPPLNSNFASLDSTSYSNTNGLKMDVPPKTTNELVVDISSTDRIKELIGILTNILKKTNTQQSGGPILQETIDYSKEFQNFNQLLDNTPSSGRFKKDTSITSNSSNITDALSSKSALPVEDALISNEDKFRTSSNYFNDINDRYYQTKNIDTLKKSIPSPIQIDVDENSPDEDLLHSPSSTSLFAITNSLDETSSNGFSNYWFNIKGKSDLILRTKASSCPKIYGNVTLTCEIPEEFSNRILMKQWSKRIIGPDGSQSLLTLSSNDKLLLQDSRLDVVEKSPTAYQLRIESFRVQDIGSYDCSVKDYYGNEGSSQILVYNCL